MRRDLSLPPWPRLRDSWWVYGLAAALIGLSCAGFLARVRCRLAGRCGGPVGRLLDLDALGGLPRLAITAMFVVTAVLAWRMARGTEGRRALWLGTVALLGAALAVLKLVSAHSAAKADSAALTLIGSVLAAAASLTALWVLGRRWGVPATGPVVLALAPPGRRGRQRPPGRRRWPSPARRPGAAEPVRGSRRTARRRPGA